MLFAFSVILVHFRSSGRVKFHGAEDSWLSSTYWYQLVPEATAVQGTPVVPVKPSVFSWHSSESKYGLTVSHGLTVAKLERMYIKFAAPVDGKAAGATILWVAGWMRSRAS